MKSTRHRYSYFLSWETCRLSPYLQLAVYWTPPPVGLRRLLCENRFMSSSLLRPIGLAAVAVVLTYFLIMDILLFHRYQTVNLVLDSKGGAPGEIYTPITHISIKGLLNDHPSQFFIAPSTEYFNLLTGFSSVFSFITPNMISCAHLICGLISGKFIASHDLQDRRIGVILYEFRTWLDALDGTVHRAQQGLHLRYHSNHATFGYAIDALFDGLGGCFLCLGVFFYLVKRFGVGKTTQVTAGVYHTISGSKGPSDTTETSTKESVTMKTLVWKAAALGLCLAVSGKAWDLAVDEYSRVFQTELPEEHLSKLQFDLSHSCTSLVIFYLWRLFGGQSVLNYILLAVYLDKVWEFLRHTHLILLAVAAVLYLATTFHIKHICQLLNIQP